MAAPLADGGDALQLWLPLDSILGFLAGCPDKSGPGPTWPAGTPSGSTVRCRAIITGANDWLGVESPSADGRARFWPMAWGGGTASFYSSFWPVDVPPSSYFPGPSSFSMLW